MATKTGNIQRTAVAAAPTPDEMRRGLGQFASGVTVVTGMGTDGPVGFTCQSFASVSLEPPMVLFCADHRGRAWPMIRRSGRFTINILHEDQSDLCFRFGSSRGAKFEGLDWAQSQWATPSLPDVLMRVHAQVHSVHTAGDHDVVIGHVRELEPVCEEQPMVFFQGGFGLTQPGRRSQPLARLHGE